MAGLPACSGSPLNCLCVNYHIKTYSSDRSLFQSHQETIISARSSGEFGDGPPD
jgi:hypothetical protein